MHPTLPLLPSGTGGIALMLKSCPTYLRDLLFSSLRTLSISPTSENATFLQAKAKLLNISQDHKIRSFHANVVFLDILILLIISLEMSGQQNPHSGDFLSVATLLGMANRLIHFLHLPSLSRERFNSVEDGEHMYRDSRRAWWILVILDTWHAVGTAGSCMIPEYASELHANDDPEILGENLWEMARKYTPPVCGPQRHTYHLTYVGYTRLTSQLARALAYPTTRDQQMLSHSMLALLKSLHETTSQTVDINLSQIVYNHLKLLLSRLSFLAQPSLPNPSYIYLCDNIIELLKHGQTPYFPLRHHVIALAAKTLMDSTEFLATKGAAMELLSKLVEWLEAEEDEGNRKSQWDSDILMAVRTFVDSRAGNNSLENLANAAVEESGDNDADLDSTTGSSTGIDWGKIVTDGYLGASLTRHG